MIDTTSAILTVQIKKKQFIVDICISPHSSSINFSNIFYVTWVEVIHSRLLKYREKQIIYHMEATPTIWESHHLLS